MDAVTHPIGSFLAGAFNGGELEEENGKLRLANSRLEQQVLTGQARADALAALQKLEHLPWASNISTVTAQVINRSPSNFVATIELDKGTARWRRGRDARRRQWRIGGSGDDRLLRRGRARCS